VLAVAPPPRVALVPNAIAFRDPQHGIMGTGWQNCAASGWGCRPQGTISITSDGGKTWRVLFRAPRAVFGVGYRGAEMTARYDDGENVASTDGGRHWTPAVVGVPPSTGCPANSQSFQSGAWLLCTNEPGAGAQGKVLYRYTASGRTRVAYTPFPYSHGAYGGISVTGYPEGLAMASDGFGLIWEWRGTLFVTRSFGSHWVGLDKVAQPGVDFGMSGVALRHGVGFVILARGGTEVRRLIETTDAGHSWHVVHRWR
jgi:photosystem II stability/assembly factor-like uncharacterized protein